MDNSFKDKANEVIIETLSKFCMVTPTFKPENNNKESISEGFQIDFQGSRNGVMYFFYSKNLEKLLIESMTKETADTSLNREDILQEVSNIICGNLLPFYAGPQEMFQLGNPQVTHYSQSQQNSKNQEIQVSFNEGHFKLIIQ